MQSNNTQANDPSAWQHNRAAPPAAPNNAARDPSFAEPYTNPPAGDDTPSVDETLAQAMGRLSVQQKSTIGEEIMGNVGVPPENPQHMNLLLQQLCGRLQSIRHKPAFDLAMQQNPAFVNSPQFLRMFLRAERYNVNHAADRLVRHFEAKRELWGDAKLTKRITMDDFTAEEKQFFTKNGDSIQMLSIRDHAGRAVFFSHEGENAKRLVDQNPEIHNIRFLWYLIMAHIEDDDETQINGIVYVGYGVDSTPKGTKAEFNVWWAGCKAANAMPVRITGFHYCYQGPLMKPLVSLVAWGLSPITRCRIQAVCGNHAKCVKHLKTFGIPVHVLPLDEDYAASFKQRGQSKKKYLPMKLNRKEFEKFLRRRKQVEGYPMEYARRIELLTITDVIVGKGQNHQKHHGNLEFGRLVTESVTRLGAGRSNKEKADIGMKVAIQMRQNGIRFVQQVEKCGIWWLANWQAVENKVRNLTNRIKIKANKNEGEGKEDDGSTSVASKRARSMPPHPGSSPTADNLETAGIPVANEDEDEGDEGRVATTSSHQTSTGSDQDAKPAAKRRATPASAPATVPAPAVSSPAMQAGAVDDDEVQVVQVTRAPTSMQLTTSAAGAIALQAWTLTPYGAVPSPNFPQYPAQARAPIFAAYQQAAIQGRGVQMGQVGMPTGIIPNAPQLPQNLQAQQARPNLQAFGQPQQLLAGPASGLPNGTMPQNGGFQGTGAVPFQTSIAGGNMVGGMPVPINPNAAHPRDPTFAAYQQAAIQGRGVQMGQAGMSAGIAPNAPQLPQNLQAQQARPNLQAFGQPQQLLAGPVSGLPNFTMPQNLGFRGTGAVPFQTSIAGGNVVGGMPVPTNLYAACPRDPTFAAYQQASIQGRGVQMGQTGMPTGIIPNPAQLPQNRQAQQARLNQQVFGQPQQLPTSPAGGLPNGTMPQNVGFQGAAAVPFQTSIAGGNMVGGMTVRTNPNAASVAQPNPAAAAAPNTFMMPANAETVPNLMAGGVGGAIAFNQELRRCLSDDQIGDFVWVDETRQDSSPVAVEMAARIEDRQHEVGGKPTPGPPRNEDNSPLPWR